MIFPCGLFCSIENLSVCLKPLSYALPFQGNRIANP